MEQDCSTEAKEEYCEPLDLSKWMECLPSHCHDIPLYSLAIPGSHDSLTFYLDKGGPISPDESWQLQCLGRCFGPCTKPIVYNWSTVQSLSVSDQLLAGIRYFDIRLGAKPDCTDLYCVHGLFGLDITSCLQEVESFLNSQKKEVIILDFNHFYDVDDKSHHAFINQLIDQFGSKLCPRTGASDLKLNVMWSKGFQLIVLYNNPVACHFEKLWPSSFIVSHWPNKCEVPQLLEDLENSYENHRDEDKFYVTQGILTPSRPYIISHMCTTLKQSLAKTAAEPFVEWVKKKAAGPCGLNICIMDCIEMADYTESVIRLNYKSFVQK